jgi:hypothetical protein
VDLEELKAAAQIARDLSVFLGALTAGVWFLFTRGHKRKVTFRIDATTLPRVAADQRAIELRFLFENIGERQQRIFRLFYKIEAATGDVIPWIDRSTLDDNAGWVLLGHRVLQPDRMDDAPRVRSGIQTVLSDLVLVPTNVSVVRVTARLDDSRPKRDEIIELKYPARATARRHFPVQVDEVRRDHGQSLG